MPVAVPAVVVKIASSSCRQNRIKRFFAGQPNPSNSLGTTTSIPVRAKQTGTTDIRADAGKDRRKQFAPSGEAEARIGGRLYDRKRRRASV